jgi:enterochelin esterase-like enzyme
MPIHPLQSKARLSGNPVIGKERVTFLWQGRNAPYLIDDVHNWEENPQTMQRISPGLWAFSMPLAADAYLEYSFIDAKTGERIPDPLNKNRIWNGINAYNSFFFMPQTNPSGFIKSLRNVLKGKMTRHLIPTHELVSGTKRAVYLYQPPVQSPVPLLVVYDGLDYYRRGKLNIIVDNLIAAKRIRPIAMAMVQSGGSARYIEYSCSDSTLAFISECILPFAQERLDITPPKIEPYGILGSSMGGLMALYTGIRLPQIFGKVISQSGAFSMTEKEFVLADLLRYFPIPEIETWLDVGRYESLLHANHQVYALMTDRGYKVRYHEFPGGHNFTAWRDDISTGLVALFSK